MKKPKVGKFADALYKTGGNISKTAQMLGVSRCCVYNWINSDPEFSEALKNERGRMLDDCIDTARTVALGIPILDGSGAVIGWRVAPDSMVLRYLLGTLGRLEGFGENLDVTTNGKPLYREPRTLTPKEAKEYGLNLEKEY